MQNVLKSKIQRQEIPKIGGSADVTNKYSLKLGILYLNWGSLQVCYEYLSSLDLDDCMMKYTN